MFFDPPREIPARVLTRLPDRFRRMERSEWSDANRAGAPVDCFLEGPAFDAQGRLYVTDIPYGRIFRIEDGDWTQVAEYAGWPNGLKVQPDGDLLIADYHHGLIRIDPGTGGAAAVLQTVMSESFKGLNDLTLHDDESVIFTDQGHRPDAIVAKAQCFARVPPGLVGPDGLAMDAHDRLFIANPGHGCVWVIDPHGKPLYRVQSHHGRMTTNCALTPDGRALVITESETGSILIAEIPPP
jgi:gluconolactonase